MNAQIIGQYPHEEWNAMLMLKNSVASMEAADNKGYDKQIVREKRLLKGLMTDRFNEEENTYQ